MFGLFKRKDIMDINAEKVRTRTEAVNSVKEMSDLKKILKRIDYLSRKGFNGCRFYNFGCSEDPVITKNIENILKEKGFEVCYSPFEIYVSWRE